MCEHSVGGRSGSVAWAPLYGSCAGCWGHILIRCCPEKQVSVERHAKWHEWCPEVTTPAVRVCDQIWSQGSGSHMLGSEGRGRLGRGEALLAQGHVCSPEVGEGAI